VGLSGESLEVAARQSVTIFDGSEPQNRFAVVWIRAMPDAAEIPHVPE
jgi:hypothetical protein